MATNNIGANIAALRKKMGVTQETLAAAVGVSGQAVSKWESGGMPDAELFPAIADYFAVSIDRLFGRDVLAHTDIVEAFMDTLRWNDGDTWETLLERAFDYVWRMNRVMFTSLGGMPQPMDEYRPIDEYVEMHANFERQTPGIKVFSEIDAKNGAFRLCLNKERRYFLMLPDPGDGFEFDDDKMLATLKDLCDEDFFRVIVYLHRSPKAYNQFFSQQYFERTFKLTPERAQAVLEKCMRFGFTSTSEQEIDEVMETRYSFRNSTALVPFLIFAEELTHYPRTFFSCVLDEHRKWLK